MDTLTLKRALVAGCFLNVARQLPAPTKTATPKYSTVIGHQEVRRVRVSVLLRVCECVCMCVSVRVCVVTCACVHVSMCVCLMMTVMCVYVCVHRCPCVRR